jgi:hypothetical protein
MANQLPGGSRAMTGGVRVLITVEIRVEAGQVAVVLLRLLRFMGTHGVSPEWHGIKPVFERNG